ncbi:TPA: hypothetical protein ACRNCK_005291 [Pseudomonas aeruginosa]|uniref:hypothetical protein n=1 Tax=Pseudomonas aeruginosa TaxID=287 RepID=UPI00073DBF80|nr:hypothetical protein [Pseudomonas aeruginosa]ALV80245.1 hypothetical protein AOY09_05223 [Pseudomonas aeruginosa]EKW0332445.1 hypothetical protein [Pseudomonas aeruginosa]EKW2710670.1 hypothetical protein [Pseudomonas aeruginosa]EKW3864505.1 hypothetical protein [Pseudomonas aeruginosa]ELL4435517.1 hypothetical protein [Pseudomonas aeruginosa]
MSSVSDAKRPRRGKKPQGISLHPRAKYPWGRLPFVGKDHGRHSMWDVPLTGSYLTGLEAGKSIAHIYLKYVRDVDDWMACEVLRSMVRDLITKAPSDEQEETVKRGQFAGFMGEIFNWLKVSAQFAGSSLDRVEDQDLVDRVNHYLDAGVADAIDAAITRAST